MRLFGVFERDRHGSCRALDVPQKLEPHKKLTTIPKLLVLEESVILQRLLEDVLRGQPVGRFNSLTTELQPLSPLSWCSVNLIQQPREVIVTGRILPARFYRLTVDQWTILSLLELNASGSAIAGQLGLPVRTVNQRLRVICDVLQVSRNMLLPYCRRWQVREFALEWLSPSGGGLILPGLAKYGQQQS